MLAYELIGCFFHSHSDHVVKEADIRSESGTYTACIRFFFFNNVLKKLWETPAPCTGAVPALHGLTARFLPRGEKIAYIIRWASKHINGPCPPAHTSGLVYGLYLISSRPETSSRCKESRNSPTLDVGERCFPQDRVSICFKCAPGQYKQITHVWRTQPQNKIEMSSSLCCFSFVVQSQVGDGSWIPPKWVE